ncbi:MAG: hypothetical protein ABS939_15710 [Psychrobacillus sp.]
MLIPVSLLNKVETISALKVLTYLYAKSKDNGVARVSINQITDESGIARNSAKRGLEELLKNKVVEQIATGRGNQANTYKVSKVDVSKVEESKDDVSKVNTSATVEGYKKAVGSKADRNCVPIDGQSKDYINNIIYKDFKEYNLFDKDINSLSVPNENHKLNDEQLGKLARRVLVEWYLPLAKFKNKQSNFFFPQQMKLIKDLLVQWRTEQVLAGIQYWTKVNPPKDGMKSVAWLKFERKGTSYMMVALDYYKQQNIEQQSEHEQEERANKVEEMKANAIKIAQEKLAKKIEVDSMSDNDFLKDLLGGIGKIEIKEE